MKRRIIIEEDELINLCKDCYYIGRDHEKAEQTDEGIIFDEGDFLSELRELMENLEE